MADEETSKNVYKPIDIIPLVGGFTFMNRNGNTTEYGYLSFEIKSIRDVGLILYHAVAPTLTVIGIVKGIEALVS